jgi:trans-aconitate methyltransferase
MRPDPSHEQVDLRTDVAHSARIYDYILGGKDNFPPDRAAAAQMLENWPNLRSSMRLNRQFMARVVEHLAIETGVEQFLDVGTGIPTSPNLHEVVQAVIPHARVVYVDNDPIVLTHARALLTSDGLGRTAYVEADLTSPETILDAPEYRETLDLNRPVALSIIAVLQLVPDEMAYDVVRRLMEPLPSGSYLVLSMPTADYDPNMLRVVETYRAQGMFQTARTKAQVEAFFDGMELIDPGITLVHRWRPDPDSPPLADNETAMYGAVARKP